MKHFRLFFLSSIAAVSFSASAFTIPPPPAAPSAAANVTLGAQFTDGIKIQEFAKVVLRDVLKAQFVFSSDFLSDASFVGFSASSLKKSGSESLLKDVLSQHGYSLEFRQGYYRIFKTRPEDKLDSRIDFVYRLKHRDLSYLSSQLTPLFGDRGTFTFKRSVDAGADARPQSKDAVDDGRSLLSMSTQTSSDLLLFRGEPSDVERLKSLLAQLDVPVPRVLVRAIVLETRNVEQAGYSVSAVARLLSNKLNLTIPGTPVGNLLTFSSSSFESVISALQGDSTVNILTAPSVFAETGSPASLSVGASVPTLGAIQYDGDGRSQQSVTYTDTGVILRITPRVLDGSISLSVEQEISDAVQTQTGVTGSPTFTKSNLRTAFNLKPGESAILGGLTLDKSSTARDSLPFWRRITLGQSSSKSTSDLIVILYAELS